MASYKLVVFSDAVEGREEEYNDWYTNTHLDDVVAVPGFVSAQRYKLRTIVMGEFKHRYMAIYNIESDDPDKVIEEMMCRRGTEAMILSDGIDLETATCALYETITREVFALDAKAKADTAA